MKLSEACKLIVDCPHTSAKDEGKGIALIRTPNVGKGRLILENVHRVSEKVYQERIARAVPTAGDLILAREAPVGNVAIIQEGQKVCLGQRVVLLRADEEIVVPDYLVYYLLSRPVQHRLLNQTNETTVAHLNVAAIRNLEINLPPLSTQRRISSVLSSLDRKIELNNKINATLEEMAQALFKSWFVDFEPFKNGNFIDSEIGKIPEGWRVGTLGEVCDYSKKRVAVTELSKDSYFSTENMLPNKQGAVAASSLPAIGLTTGCLPEDVLISNIRPYFKKILRVKEACGCSTDVMCFHPKESIYSTFMYRVLYDDKFFDFVMAGTKGTKMPRGDKKQIMSYPIVLAPNDILEAFSKVIEPMLEKCASLSQETLTLSHLRDTLLPRLMSGEIEV